WNFPERPLPPTRITGLLMLASAALPVSSAFAASAPPTQLQGKSIIVSWVEARIQRRVREEEFRPATRHGELRIYVNTAGRVFHRLSMESRRASGSTERVGDTKNRKFSFDGNTLVAIQAGATGGARHVNDAGRRGERRLRCRPRRSVRALAPRTCCRRRPCLPSTRSGTTADAAPTFRA